MRHMVLTNDAAESNDHHYQDKRMIEHLRGQLALVKGSEMNMVAEMGNHDLEQKRRFRHTKLKSLKGKCEHNSFSTRQG